MKFEEHQTFDQKLKLFPLFSCLMGDVLFVLTAAYQACLMRACVPRLLSGLYQLFDLCLIKHVLTVRPLTSTSACLVTEQCLMVPLVAKHFPFVQGIKPSKQPYDEQSNEHNTKEGPAEKITKTAESPENIYAVKQNKNI